MVSGQTVVLRGGSHVTRAATAVLPGKADETAREVDRPVGLGELSARLSEERGLWSSCLDQKIGHLADLMGALEQRLESGLEKLGSPLQQSESAAGCYEEPPQESGAHRLPSDFSVLSGGNEDTSSASTGTRAEPHAARHALDGKIGHLSVMDTMCRAVEALQDQSRILRSEIKALQAQQLEQSDVNRQLASGLEDLRQLTGLPGQPAVDLEEIRSQVFQSCGDIAALRSQVLSKIEAPAPASARTSASRDVEVLEAQIGALRAQVSAIGAQQGALQLQTGHAAAVQQRVISDLGATKGQLIHSIVALQNEVQRQGGRLGALLQGEQAQGGRSRSPQGRTPRGGATAATAAAGPQARAAEAEAQAKPELEAGCTVTVLEDFASSSKGSVLLREGWEGEVVRIDQDGDAMIRFAKQKCKEWVVRRNFHKLRVSRAAEESEETDSSDDEGTTNHRPGTEATEATEATELEHEEPCSCNFF